MNFQPLKDFCDFYLPMLGIPMSDTVIYCNHEEIFRYSAGYDDPWLRIPTKRDALYNLYSCTKVATAVAATQLIERGELLPSDPLYAYFPEYKEMQVKKTAPDGSVTLVPATKPILVEHLLTMTSGMNYNLDTPSIAKVRRATNGLCPTLDIVRALADEPLESEPGEHYLYSLGLDVVGGLVELVSGLPLGEYMKRNIFDPLGMTETGFTMDETIVPRMASQYRYNEETGAPEKIPVSENPYRFGSAYQSAGAGLISSVKDQILFADALANMGKGKSGERILSPAGVDVLRANRFDESKLSEFPKYTFGYGYGYGVRTAVDPKTKGNLASDGEFGWDGARRSYISADPARKLAVFHAEHMNFPNAESVIFARLRNVIYACVESD